MKDRRKNNQKKEFIATKVSVKVSVQCATKRSRNDHVSFSSTLNIVQPVDADTVIMCGAY